MPITPLSPFREEMLKSLHEALNHCRRQSLTATLDRAVKSEVIAGGVHFTTYDIVRNRVLNQLYFVNMVIERTPFVVQLASEKSLRVPVIKKMLNELNFNDFSGLKKAELYARLKRLQPDAVDVGKQCFVIVAVASGAGRALHGETQVLGAKIEMSENGLSYVATTPLVFEVFRTDKAVNAVGTIQVAKEPQLSKLSPTRLCQELLELQGDLTQSFIARIDDGSSETHEAAAASKLRSSNQDAALKKANRALLAKNEILERDLYLAKKRKADASKLGRGHGSGNGVLNMNMTEITKAVTAAFTKANKNSPKDTSSTKFNEISSTLRTLASAVAKLPKNNNSDGSRNAEVESLLKQQIADGKEREKDNAARVEKEKIRDDANIREARQDFLTFTRDLLVPKRWGKRKRDPDNNA